MKKSVMILVSCLLVLAGTAANKRTEVTKASEFVDNSTISKSWRTTPVSVKGGGESPDVMTLLTAFQRQWPTWAAGQVLEKGATLKDGEQYEEVDEDWRVLVDRRNGYCDLASETDVSQVQACVWRRKDGHRLFAVSLYEQHDPVTNLLCWYDYDPTTETMKAERSPADEFKPDMPAELIAWSLPMRGTDFNIYEYQTGLPRITHVYKWDGQQHHREALDLVDDFWMDYNEDDEARMSQHGNFTYYALLDLTGRGSRQMWIAQGNKDLSNSDVIGTFEWDFTPIGTASHSDPDNIQELSFIRSKDMAIVITTFSPFEGSIYKRCAVIEGDGKTFIIDEEINSVTGGRSVNVYGGTIDEDEAAELLRGEAEELAPQNNAVWHKFKFTDPEP